MADNSSANMTAKEALAYAIKHKFTIQMHNITVELDEANDLIKLAPRADSFEAAESRAKADADRRFEAAIGPDDKYLSGKMTNFKVDVRNSLRAEARQRYYGADGGKS